MALTTEEAAYNTALIAVVTAWKALYDAKAGSGDILIQLVPLDVGQDSTYNTATQATAVGDLVTMGTGPRPSFSAVHSITAVNDGEFPICLPGTRTPIFYAVTNQPQDLA